MKMTFYIFIIVILGIFSGYFFLGNKANDIDLLITIILNITIFSVGISLGLNKGIFKELKKTGKKIMLLPIGTIVGSLLGGVITGFLLNHSLNLSLAIASGFGWYSISAVILTESAGTEIGSIAFLANVFREMMAFLFIPIIAKKITPYTAISIGGATTMDTTLPLITKSTSEKYAIVSFIHGGALSFLVPVLVPFFASL